jgi:hypothetical protein
MPEGMSYEGVLGSENRLQADARPMSMALVDRAYPSGGGGSAMPVPIMQSRKAAPMREQAQEQVSNLDPAIAALIARVKAGTRPNVDEAKFVFGGEAYVRLTLSDASTDALNRLRQAGLVITGQQGNMISGHVPVAGLESLSKLPNVQRIFPR